MSLEILTNITQSKPYLNGRMNTLLLDGPIILNNQATTKAYVDGNIPGVGNLTQILINGNSAGANQINMNDNKIINLATPTLATDAATKAYVDSSAPTGENLTDVLTNGNNGGGLNMTNIGTIMCNSLSTTTDITAAVITAPVIQAGSYDDGVGNSFLTITNGGQPTLTNTLNANSHIITNGITPVNPTDYVIKSYVDGSAPTGENLTDVLTNGNNAGGLNIVNLGNLGTTSVTAAGSILGGSISSSGTIIATGSITTGTSLISPAVNANSYNDRLGNPFLTIANGGQPTLTNTLNANSNYIINGLNPVNPQDLATKSYVDGSIPTGETLSVVLTNGNNAGGLNMTNVGTIGVGTINATGNVIAPVIESASYDDSVGNSFLTIANGGQPTFTNTVQMGANPINFSVAAGASDQTLMTMGSSASQRLVFEIGDTANDFNGKIIFGGANSNIKEVPATGLEIQSAGSFLQLNSALAVNGTGLTDTVGHIVYKSGQPSLATGPGCGTPIFAAVVSGSDMSGNIQIETVSTGTASSVVATITFVNAWGGSISPHVVLSPASASTASLSGNAVVYISSTTSTTFVMSVGSTALPNGTYTWNYVCMY